MRSGSRARADVAAAVFFGLIIYLLWRTLQCMPRVKPPKTERARARPSPGTTSPAWRRRRRSCTRSSTSCASPSASSASARASRRASSSTARPAPARRCSRRRSPASPARSFYSQSASAFVEMFAGLGAARIRKLFEEARKNAPAIVFIDELDAVGAARTGDGFNREHDQTLNQLLVELDGFDVARAGRRDGRLEPAPGSRPRAPAPGPLRPPGAGRAARSGRPRGDPARAHARQAARRRRRPRARSPGRPPGLTGADLANLCNEAAIFAGRQRAQRSIRQADFEARWSAWSRACSSGKRRHREGEADPRLPRGRPRAHVAPDGRPAPGPEGDDRLARPGARLHAQPARPRSATCTPRRSSST